MIATARRIKPRRDGSHSFQQYFLYWTAFNSIYTTIAYRKGRRTRVKKNDDGSVVTIANGSVNIPEVVVVSEREQIQLALDEFSNDLKHKLILHQGTKIFLDRVPYWEGQKIEQDAFGQKLNGVINVDYTTDRQYPVWSPIDFQSYEGYFDDPDNGESRDFLVRQIVAILYTVRCNLMHGGKRFDDANDLAVIENALPMLELIVASFTC
jgi:hypothetical protein